MSVIQSIRERYAKWAVIAIALALLGFILTDYFQAKNKMGSGNSSTLGLVNGKKIDYISFETKLKARDDQQQAALQQQQQELSLIHISEPTRLLSISYAVFCLKK